MSISSPFVDKGRLRALLKRLTAKRAQEFHNLSRNQLKIMTGPLTGHYYLKGHVFKLGLVDSPRCDRCIQASEMASHLLCDCEAMGVNKI
jgi:hypothetical protein